MFWQHVIAIVWKDWALERRTKQSVSSMLVFAVMVIVTFDFALGARMTSQTVALGLLWTIIFLAGTIGINRTFSAETETRALDAVLIAPIDRSVLFVGKLLSLFLTILATEVVLIPLFYFLFDQPFYRPGVLMILLLGTLGYVAAGVFVGSRRCRRVPAICWCQSCCCRSPCRLPSLRPKRPGCVAAIANPME